MAQPKPLGESQDTASCSLMERNAERITELPNIATDHLVRYPTRISILDDGMSSASKCQN